jgi:hypothetical protein
MRDLTASFVQAMDSTHVWDPSQIAFTVMALLQHEQGHVSWSPEAGEEWIILTTAKGENYALIWTRAALAIIVPTVSPPLRTALVNHGAVLVEVADWNTPDFSIDPVPIRMRNMPSFWPVPSNEVPTAGFSILDLVWVTI